MDNTTVEGSLDDTTILDTYNATPEAASYEITPEKEIELQALQKHRAWLELPVEPTDYSTLSGKQNRTIRDSIDFIVGDDQELYSKPATSKQDYFERGFLDQDGKSTEKGLLAMTLVEKGVLNKDFTVSENGQIFTLKESDFFTDGNEEAQTTYTSYFEADPSRYDKMLEWKRAKEYGLFNEVVDSEKEKSFGETIEEKAKGAGEFFYNTGKTIRSIGRTLIGADALNLIGVPQSEEGETKDKLRAYGAAEGFFENGAHSFLTQAAGVSKLTNAIDEKTGLITKEQADAFNTFNEYKAASLKNFQNKTKTVEALASAAGIDAAADLLASGEQVFGKERSEAIQAEGQQPGEMAGDWVNIELGPIMKLGSMAVGSSSRLLNSVVNAKNIKQVEQITFNSAKSSLYAAEANKSASMARMFGNEVEAAALLEKEAVTFGNTTEAVAHAANKAKYAKNAAVATEQAGKYAAESQALRGTANVLENTLPPTLQSQLAMAGKVSVATPLKVIGAASKKLGDTLAVVDRGASAMLGVFGMSKFRGLARAAGVFTGYVNPLTIAEGIVASNKIWNGAGRLLNSLGENMLVNQGTTPFFRRVAADMATPVGKTFATVADSFIPPVAKGVGTIAKGVKSAAVPSLIYQTINHQGLDANVLKQAASDAIVFGAPLGAVHIGKSFDFKATRQADRANFNNKIKGDPAQYEIYNSMVDPPTKDVISSFSAAYPNAKVQLVTEGASFQRGNTVVLNVNAPKEIASVVALHELNHFLSNELQANDLIVQQMVGDKTRPGEIFTKNGTIDPEFVKFGNEYNRRMEAMGEKPLGINDMAIEFYTDKAAEVLMRDISSGEFTKRAQESKLSRSVKSHFSTFVNQVPIIKNIHIKMGGAIDYSGRLVAGSGLVSEGITQSAGVQAMVRKMYRDTSGLSRPPRPTAKNGTSTTQPPPTRSTRDGVNNGTAAVENVNKAGRDAGLEVPEGALDPSTPRGMDGVPTPLQTKAIIDSGAIAPDHLGTFPLLVAEMVPDSTATFMFEYFPAEQGRTPQSAAGESFHHVKPAGVKLNKDGKVLIAALDINLWDQNIKRVANSKAAKDLGYSEKDIRADSYEASKFHIKNQSPDAYFEGKYGKDQAARRKSLVAATYGEMTAKQRSTNPLLTEVGMEKADGVYRTFSLDDIKRSTRTNASVELAFDPNNYYSLKANLMPEAPIVDRSGNIIENPMMKDFFENHLPSGQRFRENPATAKTANQNATMRYMPEAVNKIPKSEGGYLKPSTWESLENVGYKPSASEKTQIATTASTYEKIANANAKKGMRVLDFAAGRGNGTASIKEIGKSKGFEVSGYEPYSNPKTRAIAPEYEGMDSLAQIPNNSYDLIINNAVLNVVPESVGRGIARDIYSKLAPEGSAFINVMGWSNIKSRLKNPKTKLVGPREVVTQKGTFQKGYTTETLRALIESELPDAKVVRTNYGDIGFKVTKPPVKIVKEEISMPTGIPNISSGSKRFLPEPVEKLSAFAGKRVQVLTSDLSVVKEIKSGNYVTKFTGGPGYLDNNAWGFTGKDAAEAFITRWKKDGQPLIGLASLGPANHLNSLSSRKAYGEKWKGLVDSGVLNELEASSHIQEAMSRIAKSDAKSVKPDWKDVALKINNATDLAKYFDKIPWAASPMFYEKLTAKTLPIAHKELTKYGLDLESVAKEYRQPEFHKSELGDLFAIAEYDGSAPVYKPELNEAYPWQIKFSKRATLSEMHNVADLTTDPRAFAGKKVGGRLGAQPLMVTGINLDRLMSGDLKASGKPLIMQPETAKTKSDLAKGFGSGNPSGYQPYIESQKPVKP